MMGLMKKISDRFNMFYIIFSDRFVVFDLSFNNDFV